MGGHAKTVPAFEINMEQGFYRDCVKLHSNLFSNGFDNIGYASILYELGLLSEDDFDMRFEESISMLR